MSESVKKQKNKIQQQQNFSLWFDRPGLEPTIYHTRGEHANYYITDSVYWSQKTCSF